jgi:hypothetical protein
MIHTSTILEVQTEGMLEFGPRCRKLDRLLFVTQSAIYLRFKAVHAILSIGQRAFEGLKPFHVKLIWGARVAAASVT